jgi:P-type Cu+ transporter
MSQAVREAPAEAASPSSTATLLVPGMGSDHCAGLVSTSLRRLTGVGDVRTNVAMHRVEVAFDSDRLEPADLAAAVERAGYDVDRVTAEQKGPQQVRLSVPGMGSDHCAGLVSTSIRRLPGIASVDTNIGNHRVTVGFDPHQTSADVIRAAVERAGYDVARVDAGAGPVAAPVEDDVEERYLAQAWGRLVFAAIPATLIMAIMVPHMMVAPVPFYLAIVAVLAFPVVFLRGGWATHRSAWRALTNRTANMDVLISMGSLPPYFIGLVGFFTPMTSFMEMAATIMTFHLLGRYLETRAKGRASQAIKRLITLGAKTAQVERDGREVEVPVAELASGDVMVVRPGAKVPTDGEIGHGAGHGGPAAEGMMSPKMHEQMREMMRPMMQERVKARSAWNAGSK